MLRCREVARAISTEGLGRMSWWDRLRLGVHLRLCPPCHEYARQLEVLGRAARELCAECEPCAEELRRLEAAILASCLGGETRGRDRGDDP